MHELATRTRMGSSTGNNVNRGALVPLAALVALGVTGCGSTVNGTASPGVVATSTPPVTASSPPGLAAVQPCDLLDAATLAQNQLTSDGPRTGNGARSCGWSNDAYDNGLGYSLGVDIRDAQGISTYNKTGFSVTDTQVGSHQAIEARGTTSDLCDITIAITPTSRVDIDINTGAVNVTKSCDIVEQFAKVIEPNLP